jgi:exodeoxyribonuclease VII small subunit
MRQGFFMVKAKKNSSFDGIDATGKKGWIYEERIAEIEDIISRIETGELDLEEVFDEFTTAVEFLRECEKFLVSRQEQVDLLVETLKEE